MKVYLVHNEYYDYDEYAGGSMLLGIYSSMELAVSARNDFVAAELAEAAEMNYPVHTSTDAENNPVITYLCNDEAVKDDTFSIEEWTVDDTP